MLCKRLLRLSIFAGLMVFSTIVFAQTRVITGKVTDSKDGSPIIGASVLVKGSSVGTVTGADGEFSISVPEKAGILEVSSVGYTTQDVNITGQSNIAVSLVASALTENLNEVIVIGYGTAQRKDVTGAVASLSNKDFSSGVITNPMQQVAGKVPGLVITQPSGDPNQTVSIRLRGQTSLNGNQSPLIVVDGTPLSDPNQISNINPNDIASYDVLKDASATAIYGSRGANGVIIINTKKGRSGKGTVEYNGYVGFDKNAKKYDFLNAQEYIKNGGPNKDGNTDWVDAITQTGFTQNHSVAISGGVGGFNYRGGATYMNQKGIIINTGREMYALNFNGQQKALDGKLDIKLGINSTFTNRKYADYGIFYFVQNIPPTEPIYLANGNYNPYVDFDVFNPLQRQYAQLNKGNERLNQYSGSADYELVRGLKVGVAGSLSYFSKQTDYFKPTLSGENNVNSGNKYLEHDNMMRGDFHINYSKAFGRHNIAATAVYENNYFSYDNFRAQGENYLYEDNTNNDLGSGNPAANIIGSYKRAYKLISFLGRVVYNYDSKYYLTASLRRDGSSKFGTRNQWGYFPSVSGAWRLSNEDFIKNISWINELKLSAGFGLTGNSDAIDPYKNLLLLGSTNTYYNPATPNFAYRRAYSPVQNANPDLKWETRQGFNIGLDFTLFSNRLSGNLNVFNDKTRDLLYNYTVPVPPFFVNNIYANVGNLSNKGVELQLNTSIVQKNRFRWDLGGQISFIKTKVEKLSGTYAGFDVATDNIDAGYAQGRGLSNSPITYLKVGYSPYTFFLPHFVGLDKDGKQLFDDGKGGKVTSTELNNDMKRYTDPAPKFTYGINNNLSYGQWGLNFFLRGISGQKLFSNTRMNIDNISGLQGRNTTLSGIESGNKDIKVPSDLWLLNASFLRLDNATLSYTFKTFSDNIKNIRLYITGNNLFVITKYKGLDPEIQVASTNNAYIDFNTGENGYYKSRGIVVGVNVTF